MSLKSKAKKIGKAILFKKLFDEIMAKKENRDEDLLKLSQFIEEWKAEAADDLNVILASILIKAQDTPAEDIKAEVEKAKVEYHAEDEDVLPWFENQIDAILEEKENEEANAE